MLAHNEHFPVHREVCMLFHMQVFFKLKLSCSYCRKTIGNKHLTQRQLIDILTEVKAVINSHALV